MTKRALPLRWLIGGIYFGIILVILGSLTFYLSYLITRNTRETIVADLTGQARLAAELLAVYVDDYGTLDAYLNQLTPRARDQALSNAARARLFGKRRDDYLLSPGDEQRLVNGTVSGAVSGNIILDNIRKRIVVGLSSIARSTTADSITRGYAYPYRIAVLRSNGELIAERPHSGVKQSSQTLAPEVVRALSPDAAAGVDIRVSDFYQSEMMFVAVPVQVTRFIGEAGATRIKPVPQRITRGALVIAMPTDNLKRTTNQLQLSLLLAFIGAVLVIFFINFLVSSLFTGPLGALNWVATRFAGGELDRRVEPTGALEIASLGHSFNTMAEQLSSTILKLAQERAQAQAVLTSMFDGLIVTDVEGRILLINQSFERMFDMRADAVLGLKLSETTFRDELDELLRNTIASGLPLMHEVTFGIPTERVFEVHMAPVEVDSHLIGVVIVLYDVTAQRQFARIQRDFVANVSHELRTPVASIRAMAETLADAGHEDPEMAREFLETIIHETERLTSLLEDLLQLSRMESGRHLLAPERLNVSAIIRHVAQRVIPPITAKGQQLAINVPETLFGIVDRDAFVQILVNLLENACKYSPEGAHITVEAEDTDDRLRLRVSDTGIGIPEDELDRIFERFYRVDKARSRAQGGTGLGLSIVRHLVELHGGWISVQSQLGKGSTFIVALPHTREAAAPVAGGDAAETEEAGALSSAPVSPAAGDDGLSG